MPPEIITRAGLVAVALWAGGAAALVTSAEIDRRLHPLDYPQPYEPGGWETFPESDEPSAEPLMPLQPGAYLSAEGCAI